MNVLIIVSIKKVRLDSYKFIINNQKVHTHIGL